MWATALVTVMVWLILKKGFKIGFKAKKLEFKNVKNLASLKIEGSAGMDGSTTRNSRAATFEMKLNARDFIFKNYALGNLISDLKYRDGTLETLLISQEL